MNIEKLFENVKHKILKKGIDFEIKGLEYDSRKVSKDYIFFALVGATVDGHNYIEKGIELGAKLIIISKELDSYVEGITYVMVDDVRQNMGIIASNHYNHPHKQMTIIGITGTNGKTTSTFILEGLLGKVARIGTVEYKIGDEVLPAANTTPESLDLLKICKKAIDKDIKYLIMEVSSHALLMGRVEMIDFDYAMFTNLSQDHLDFHKNMDEYFNAKKKLFYKLKDPKNAVINIDDSYGKKLFDEFGGIGYGIKNSAELKGEIIDHCLKYMNFNLNYRNKKYKVSTRLMGEFNLYNILGSIGVALKIGVPVEQILKKVAMLEVVPGRFEALDCGQNYMVVVDYAHTPDGLTNILASLNDIKKGRIITVFGAGGDRDKTKRPLMAIEAAKQSDYVIITSDNPRTEDPKSILDDVEVGFKTIHYESYSREVKREEAIKEAINMAKENDIVLLAGKGHETYQIIGVEKHDFDDKKFAKLYIEEKRCL